ncbi:MAG TPA: hypothetical protein VHK69_13005 [Chitinophagaceae bacterium]|jgi:hypothetical protein|nr:hypothetical protein [Chitinophagaceae bacterium]
MARKNFMSSDFFLDLPEEKSRQIILTLPELVPHIHYMGVHPVNQSVRFLFERQDEGPNRQLDVALLPLNDSFTRVALRASYVNGHAFEADSTIGDLLAFMEAAILAAARGERVVLPEQGRKRATPNRWPLLLAPLASLMDMTFLWKKA